MIVKDLITKLNKLVEDNPDIGLLEVKWYDHFRHELCYASKELPIKLYENIYTGLKYCILNVTDNPPAYGYTIIPAADKKSKKKK